MYKLEENRLATLLATPGLHPRRLSVTIRHADWWYWESDEPLKFEGEWIRRVSEEMAGSVREVCIELESLERKQGQIDNIAKQMRERWFFKRKDGIALYADVTGASDEVTRWSGTSTWNRQRWTRDETEEGRLDYYVLAVWFRPEHVVQRRGGSVSDEAKHAAENGIFDSSKLKLSLPPMTERLRTHPAFVPVNEPRAAGAMSANAAQDEIDDFMEAMGLDDDEIGYESMDEYPPPIYTPLGVENADEGGEQEMATQP